MAEAFLKDGGRGQALTFPTMHSDTYLVAPELPSGIPSYDRWLLTLVNDGCRRRFGVNIGAIGSQYRERIMFESIHANLERELAKLEATR
jgi:hypothetical protein